MRMHDASNFSAKEGTNIMPKQQVTVGCLFAAIGGFARAFEQAGAKILWANEKDKFARETFVANFPNVGFGIR